MGSTAEEHLACQWPIDSMPGARRYHDAEPMRELVCPRVALGLLAGSPISAYAQTVERTAKGVSDKDIRVGVSGMCSRTAVPGRCLPFA